MVREGGGVSTQIYCYPVVCWFWSIGNFPREKIAEERGQIQTLENGHGEIEGNVQMLVTLWPGVARFNIDFLVLI